ncbi:VOC family protein [Pelomonas sp. KK5]|uniref:VOC family protein n=1 Tax=Pelomonas sp. KK5 TaxID=1855730 RepID=UPI00097C336B|nr:VOC family protein [Pelomonas sp. KK5]
MSSPWISGLRSVALDVPDLARAERFYTEVWHLAVAARSADAIYLRGTGADHHLLALHRADRLAIRKVTLRARGEAALKAIAEAAGEALWQDLAPIAEPSGGQGLMLRDPDGRLFEVVHGDARHADTTEQADRPVRLAHAVLNSHALPASQAWLERTLGFTLADRSRIMAFMNCDRDHHTLALGDADNDALNHIAFVMPDLDSVMRGGGRMRDAGHAIEWGPGRHGPGNNAFNYFIGPFGEVIEYTAEVEQIDDSYRPGGPADWTWPPGRVDQWGISQPPSAALKEAQRHVFFIPT